MKVKTSELIGPALDWAVARVEGTAWATWRFNEQHRDGKMHYSTDWAQGGPIIERGRIELAVNIDGDWLAKIVYAGRPAVLQIGPTALIAAMRCYVASKLGDEVDVPEELTCPR